jgi:predicted HicB family RNase H-like nuclease
LSSKLPYRGYSTSIEFDTEDKILIGRVLDTEDIVTFHAESVAEFEAHFHAAVDDYMAASEQLDALREKHHPVERQARCDSLRKGSENISQDIQIWANAA